VPRFAGSVAVLNSRAVHHMRAAAAAGHAGPEIIEDVAMKSNALARLESNCPYADAIAFRDQSLSDAAVRFAPFSLEFGGVFRRPSGVVGVDAFLVGHAEGHGVPPSCGERL